MDTIIELQRQTHEEIERLERGLANVLSRPMPTLQARLTNEHKASQILNRITSRAVALNNLYEDKDARDADISALSTTQNNVSGRADDDLAEFYQRLGRIKEHHQKYPDSVVFEFELAALVDEPIADEDEEYEEEDPVSLLFSGEEAFGRYLDLYANHAMFTNLRNLPKRLSYLQYLDVLLATENGPVHKDLPQEVRTSKDFEAYLTALHAYLLSYTKRTQPLQDIDKLQQEAEAEFATLWDEYKVEGWDFVKQRPKSESEGLWCATCHKMYAKQTVYDAHLKSKKHINGTERLKGSTAIDSPTGQNGTAGVLKANGYDNRSKYRSAARLTHLISKLLLSLVATLNDTKANVERRFSLTARERELELEEAKKPKAPPPPTKNGAHEEEEEEEEKIYNPLKLPLGWDGKPIPYWLYKLHGLGVEYRCEICSDHVYMGRKNFERHFQESRHAFGMRALGLPNTKHFHEITKIEDALALAEKLKLEGRQEIVQQETTEELEDDEGNVYNKKTYDDLKKQGLI